MPIFSTKCVLFFLLDSLKKTVFLIKYRSNKTSSCFSKCWFHRNLTFKQKYHSSQFTKTHNSLGSCDISCLNPSCCSCRNNAIVAKPAAVLAIIYNMIIPFKKYTEHIQKISENPNVTENSHVKGARKRVRSIKLLFFQSLLTLFLKLDPREECSTLCCPTFCKWNKISRKLHVALQLRGFQYPTQEFGRRFGAGYLLFAGLGRTTPNLWQAPRLIIVMPMQSKLR